MSKHKYRLNKLEARAEPDAYRNRCFVPWEHRIPLTASEWVELNDIEEEAYQAFQAHLTSGKIRLLGKKEIDELKEKCQETGDFEELLTVITAPDVYTDPGTWDFLEQPKLKRGVELLKKYIFYQVLNSPESPHSIEDWEFD